MLQKARAEWAKWAKSSGQPAAEPSERPGPSPGSASSWHAAGSGQIAQPLGDPAQDTSDVSVAKCPSCRDRAGDFRIQCTACLLTWNGFEAGGSTWADFKSFVTENKKKWSILYYGATMEECRSRRIHFHLMLQFRSKVKLLSKVFIFKGVRPNVRPSWSDLCGEEFSKRRPQRSFDRGFFYVWADKIGTCRDEPGEPCVWGNYAPVWTELRLTYVVPAKWPEALWKQRKVSHAKWREYLYLTRDGAHVGVFRSQRVGWV